MLKLETYWKVPHDSFCQSKQWRWSQDDQYIDELQRISRFCELEDSKTLSDLLQGVMGEYVFSLYDRVHIYTVYECIETEWEAKVRVDNERTKQVFENIEREIEEVIIEKLADEMTEAIANPILDELTRNITVKLLKTLLEEPTNKTSDSLTKIVMNKTFERIKNEIQDRVVEEVTEKIKDEKFEELLEEMRNEIFIDVANKILI